MISNKLTKLCLVGALGASVLSGCGLLRPKNAELFQKKVPSYPQPSPKLEETQKQAAEFVVETLRAAQLDLREPVTNVIQLQEKVAPKIDAGVYVAEPLSLSLGPPSQPWRSLQDMSNGVEVLRRELGKYQQDLRDLEVKLSALEGKKIEGTGLVRVSYWTVFGGGLVLLLVIVVMLRLALMGTGIGLSVVPAKVVAEQVITGGLTFLETLRKLPDKALTKSRVEELFKAAQKSQQDEKVRAAVRKIISS